MKNKIENINVDYIKLLTDIKMAYNHIENILDNIEYKDFKYCIEANSIKGELKKLYNTTYEDIKKNEKEKVKLITSACCNNCDTNLLISDNIDYSYQCESCDENFYDFEVTSAENLHKEEEKVIKEIPSSFEIELIYDKDEEMVYIGTENSSGLKYECKNIKELSNIIEEYCDNLMLDLEEMEREI